MSDKKTEFPCGPEGVESLLPHRPPFRWVDRIIECEPGKRIVAELDVREDLPLFEGHFPGHPVFPGVLLMEALAQAACCCVFANPEQDVRVGYFAGLDKAKFRETILPGDTVRLEAEILRNNGKFCKASTKAYKGDKLAAEAEQKYFLAADA